MQSPRREHVQASGPRAVGTPESETDQFSAVEAVRDNIAARAERLDQHFPRAVDLTAKVVCALAGRLRGTASQHAGTHTPEQFRKALRGERVLTLDDLCRLATTPTREAREGVILVLDQIASALDRGRASVTAHEAMAALAEGAGTVVAGLGRALANDGHIDSTEASELEPEVLRLEAKLDQLKAALAESRK